MCHRGIIITRGRAVTSRSPSVCLSSDERQHSAHTYGGDVRWTTFPLTLLSVPLPSLKLVEFGAPGHTYPYHVMEMCLAHLFEEISLAE